MLMTVEQLKKDAQVSWRVSKLIKQSVSWWASRNARSENEEGVVLLKEALEQRAKKERLVFMLWKGKVWIRDNFYVGPFIEEALKEKLQTEKNLIKKLFISRALKGIEKANRFKFLVPFERIEVFYSFWGQNINWEEVDIPWEKRVPSLLYLSLKTIGVDAYRLPPKLYEYISPHELDLNKPFGGIPGNQMDLKISYKPKIMKAIETLDFPKSLRDLSDSVEKLEEIALDLILKGKFSFEEETVEGEEKQIEDELPF